jgi:hypothetical protein
MQNDGSSQPSATVRFDLTGPIFDQIENFRRSQPKIPSRPDAIRELLKRALDNAFSASGRGNRSSRTAETHSRAAP